MAVRVERSVMPMQAYAWTLLNVSEPWSIKFNSSGSYSRHLVRFSLSGLPEEDDLTVELDGEHLLWTPRDDIGVDRWHYDVHRNQALGDGEHELKFKLNNKNREGVAQLCSAEVLEFGDQSEYALLTLSDWKVMQLIRPIHCQICCHTWSLRCLPYVSSIYALLLIPNVRCAVYDARCL